MRQRESSAITIIILAVLCGTEGNGQQKKDKLGWFPIWPIQIFKYTSGNN